MPCASPPRIRDRGSGGGRRASTDASALWCGQLDTARVTFEGLYESFQRAGMEFQRPFRLLDLADLEIASGNLARAAELVDEGMEAATDAGNDQAAAWLGYSAGVVNAHLGASGRVARRRRPACGRERASGTDAPGC